MEHLTQWWRDRWVRDRPVLLRMRTIESIDVNAPEDLELPAVLGVPAVSTGTRQAGRERGCHVIDAPYERAAIRKDA